MNMVYWTINIIKWKDGVAVSVKNHEHMLGAKNRVKEAATFYAGKELEWKEVSNHMSVANSGDLTFSIYPIEVKTS